MLSVRLPADVEHLEDLQDIHLAERRSSGNRAGTSRSYTLEEVKRELGMAD